MGQIAINRKAKHDFFLLERYEAGICLLGYEVKSIREGRVNLKDSFVRILKGEAYLVNCHISAYSKVQGHVDIDTTRSRKLLLKKAEIERLYGQTSKKGHTIVPTAIYLKKRHIKLEIAVARAKKDYDKRETIKRRIHQKETEQAMKKHFSK